MGPNKAGANFIVDLVDQIFKLSLGALLPRDSKEGFVGAVRVSGD